MAAVGHAGGRNAVVGSGDNMRLVEEDATGSWVSGQDRAHQRALTATDVDHRLVWAEVVRGERVGDHHLGHPGHRLAENIAGVRVVAVPLPDRDAHRLLEGWLAGLDGVYVLAPRLIVVTELEPDVGP